MSLIEFSVRNYRSIYEEQTFSMEQEPVHGNTVDTSAETRASFPVHKTRVYRTGAIFGANASGKSNLLKAVQFVKDAVAEGNQFYATQKLRDEQFALILDNNAPTEFHFCMVLDEIEYEYGFAITENEVTHEYLNKTRAKKVKVFSRLKTRYKHYSEKRARDVKALEKRTRKDTLFLSTLNAWNDKLAIQIVNWFNSISIYNAHLNIGKPNTDVYIQRSSRNKRNVEKLLKAFDLSIKSVSPLKQDDGYLNDLLLELSEHDDVRAKAIRSTWTRYGNIGTAHQLYRENSDGSYSKTENQFHIFSLTKNESHGTQKLYSLTSHIVHALDTGTVLFIDEIDSNLHPVVVEVIAKLFNTPESNPNNAQLIFTTHDQTLISTGKLVKNQIWITHKSDVEMSHFQRLSDFDLKQKKLNKIEDLYRAGALGGIPRVQQLIQLDLKKEKPASQTSTEAN